MKRLMESVKIDRRQSRFGAKKVKKSNKYSSIDKTKPTQMIKEEQPKINNNKKRSRSTKYPFKLNNKKSKLLSNIQNTQKESTIKSINNIKGQKKEFLNESKSVDKKHLKFKLISKKKIANNRKFQKPLNISSSKKLKNLTNKKYQLKQRSGRGIYLEEESKPSKPVGFNEYAQKEKKISKEKIKKTLNSQKIQTPRNKKFSTKSFKNMFSTKYFDSIKNIASMRQHTIELKNPFENTNIKKPNNARSPKNKTIRSNKEIMKLPFSHLKKSAKKKLKKKSTTNLNDNKKKLNVKKSKKKLSIERKLKQMRLETKEKSPLFRAYRTKNGKDITPSKKGILYLRHSTNNGNSKFS
jgi:hypothetical protein